MLTIRSLAASALACAFLSANPSLVAADYTVKADAASTVQGTWDGWGTSLCWWANVFGDRADIADALFTLNETVAVDGAGDIPGLGFNIARYNIGGSSSNVVDDSGTEVAMKTSENMPAFKFMESFWLDWMSKDAASTSWNWKADVKQRAMLTLANQRGANQLEAFSNSPPWWMTNNRATAGGADGKKDNLQEWNHDEFVLYLATVVSKAKSDWGIKFTFVEPFNEPSETWWEFPGKQEGCHFSVDTQQTILPLLRKQLDALELQDVAIATSDENSATEALHTLDTMSGNADVMGSFEKVNTHGYQGLEAYRGPDRGGLRDLTNKLMKSLWDSEYGEKDATGLTMAESIGLDINEMGVSGFVYWQALDSGGWGLIQSNPGDKWIGTPNPNPRLGRRQDRAGLRLAEKLLVVVTVNMGDAQTVTFDLASFAAVAGPINAWTTETSGKGALHKASTVKATGKSFSAAFPAGSVMTFEIEGVTLAA
ncbi:hypothetical protein PInf_022396 [Phytophthora infestans]|nr:hypothetical protein PInf_022396 [Phytophthora infestans]